MDLIDQLETIEHEILKNNKLQLAIFSQIDNIENVKQKMTILTDKTKTSEVVDKNLMDHFDKLNKKIDKHYTILNNNINQLRSRVDIGLDQISTELPEEQFNQELNNLQGDIITPRDIQSVVRSKKSNADKIKKLKDQSNKKINIIQQNLDGAVENVRQNQDVIKKNIVERSTNCKLIPEANLPTLMKNQKDLAKECIKYHKALRGDHIAKYVSDTIKMRKEYNEKYSDKILKELLAIRKKVTKKNKTLSKLITRLN